MMETEGVLRRLGGEGAEGRGTMVARAEGEEGAVEEEDEEGEGGGDDDRRMWVVAVACSLPEQGGAWPLTDGSLDVQRKGVTNICRLYAATRTERKRRRPCSDRLRLSAFASPGSAWEAMGGMMGRMKKRKS